MCLTGGGCFSAAYALWPGVEAREVEAHQGRDALFPIESIDGERPAGPPEAGAQIGGCGKSFQRRGYFPAISAIEEERLLAVLQKASDIRPWHDHGASRCEELRQFGGNAEIVERSGPPRLNQNVGGGDQLRNGPTGDESEVNDVPCDGRGKQIL